MSDVKRIDPSLGAISGVNRHNVHSGLVVDVVESSLSRTSKLLAGISDGLYKAVGSALQRAAATGKTAAKKAVTDEYAISQSEFLAQTRSINHFVRESGGGLSVAFGFAGNVIPLLRFNTSVDGEGRVTTQVKRSGAAETLDRAFVTTTGHHRGVYEREGASRLPIKELFGPATTQMMYSNEAVMDAMEEKMAETYEKRIDHEILRVLNGWGR